MDEHTREIAKWRAAVRVSDGEDLTPRQVAGLSTRVRELEAENERLREALREIEPKQQEALAVSDKPPVVISHRAFHWALAWFFSCGVMSGLLIGAVLARW